MQTNIKIIAKMPVPAENVQTFKELAAELVERSRQEPGNVFYSLNEGKEPGMLVFVECWKDKDAIRAHNAMEHFTRILPQLVQLCDGSPTKEVWSEVEF